MGLSDFFKKGVEKPVPEQKKPEPAVKPPAQPQAAPTQTYTVQKGDSLSKIAKQYYGDANQWKIIFEANKGTISDPDKIFPGMQITIPNKK